MAHRTVEVTVADLLNPRACWILGAGASYDCNSSFLGSIPLTADLVQPSMVRGKLADKLSWLIDRGMVGASNLQEALGAGIERTIDYVRGLCLDSSPAISETASYCLAHLISLMADHLSTWQVFQWREDLGHTLPYAADNYLWLAGHAYRNPSLSLITLNYDEMLDTAFKMARFYKLGNAIQYAAWEDGTTALFEGRPSPVRQGGGAFLKLHGSLRFYSCHNPRCAMYRQPLELRKPDSSKGLTGRIAGAVGANEQCSDCNENLYELILPPGHNKTIAEGAYFDFVYDQATCVLSDAPVWIMLGYSFPPYDRDMHELLREALARKPRNSSAMHRMFILDPNAVAIADRLTNTFAPTLETVGIEETFSGLVKNIMGTSS